MNPLLPDVDYDLTEDGVWLSLRQFSIHVVPTDEGVIVHIFARGKEMEGTLAATYALDSEALEKLNEEDSE